ncbi:MAG: activase [Deltaproteobacteria bacterium]|nr:activase [Deltaproteobacteria bacterium]
MKSLGICIGASTLSSVELLHDKSGTITAGTIFIQPHNGNPRRVLLEILEKSDVTVHSKIAVTGRKFRKYINLTSLSEPESIETALSHVHGGGNAINAIVSAGGETFMVYRLGKDGRISSVRTGNKCASGTGEFFLQQIRRMALSLEDAVRCARTEKSYKVSGRCSVFCKSDCTHATNKGIPKEQVAAGLCEMMAGKIVELLQQIPRNNIMIIGGCAQNSVMVDYLKKEIHNLIVPVEAPYFEALGCALWALKNDTKPFPGVEYIFDRKSEAFPRLSSLEKYRGMVEFKEAERGTAGEGDRCILGLDVGSTTTKAVLVRIDDDRVVASVYLRTDGNPVRASRNCYADLDNQLGRLSDTIQIVGLGVTGSGRQIAGLHAMTEGVINEIIAHATGALCFDGDVDTIFEIGGQDAKYTYITNGVPSDYAMNEACSAGTGSFLEEAARETLGIEMEDIADIAFQGQNPPNFNDQCAAFISSDIKNAFHDGVSQEDIVAGLVYSICMNYNNRVKGNRPVGKKVFMQGGVCYNRSVPIAMASLTGKQIVVPPDPGLIGAFGVALEIKRRLALGLIREKSFFLKQLRDRELAYEDSFVCNGGRERCDRKCEIARIRVDNKIYPFGGACNRWYNIRSHAKVSARESNLVAHYEKLIFDTYIPSPGHMNIAMDSYAIGINKSFLVNTYFPLYYHFFSRLGFRVVLSGATTQEGMDRKSAPFCYPAEIAHGYFFDLLEKKPDYLFLPLIKGDYVKNPNGNSVTCPLSQGEPFYLASAFKDHEMFRMLKNKGRILNPSIDFSRGFEAAERDVIAMASSLGLPKKRARSAYAYAVSVQQKVFGEMEETGLKVLAGLDEKPEEFAVVIFGRSYNAFVSEAHMGIPGKFASRNITVIPFNYLPIQDESAKEEMYWSAGQRILKGARFVQRHPQLFGCYITNFSCGPDSFLVGYFRDMMGKKPSLTLELDSHVADAGLETRIEAFIDIIQRYRELEKGKKIAVRKKHFIPARVNLNHGRPSFIDSRERECSLKSPDVHLIFPSMGRLISEAGSAVFRGLGIRSSALPPAGEEALKLGRGNTSCKECLPLQITVGSLLQYLNERKKNDEKLIYFMPTASGPCRFGQYSVYMNDLIAKLKLNDVALFSANAENSYADLSGQDMTLKLWTGVVLSDIFEEIYSLLLTNAVNVGAAMTVFEDQWKQILNLLERPVSLKRLTTALISIADNFRNINLSQPLHHTPVVLLTGEIYVRHDNISRQFIVEDLAGKGFATKVSTVAEWIYYTEWCVRNGVTTGTFTRKDKLSLLLRNVFMKKYERAFRKVLSRSGLCSDKTEDVNHIIRHTCHLMKPELVGEAILTTGAAINEVLDHYCGVIAIGPFGCMPNRLAEAILTREMNMEGKRATGNRNRKLRKLAGEVQDLPFLAIESDGNRFPQIIEAKLEAFLLQAERTHGAIKGS